MKKDNGKKRSFPFLFLLTMAGLFALSTCSNPFIDQVLQPKIITFDSNGGSAIESQKIYKGETVKKPENPEKTGHDFTGWYLDNITFGREWDFSAEPDKDITLYAGWDGSGIIQPSLVISAASVTVSSPQTGDLVSGTATGSVSDNFSIGSVTWYPSGHTNFLGNTVYTASVTLAANAGFVFASPGFSAEINGQSADIVNNTGAAVTLAKTFPVTSARGVTGIAIITPPDNLVYTHGDLLNLTGLEVNIAYEDGTDENVPYASFPSKNITTICGGTGLPHGAAVSYLAHNGKPVTAAAGSKTVNTGNLTVSQKTVTITGLSAGGKVYDGTAAAVVSGIPAIDGNADGANLTIVSGTAAFADKNAGTGKSVAFTGWSLGGSAAGNYILSAPASVSANITAKPVTVTGAAHTKAYDGSTAAAGVTLALSGILPADAGYVTPTFTAEYTSAAAGTQAINVSSLALTGTESGNYSIAASVDNLSVTGGGITGSAAVINWPSGLTAVYGDTLAAVTLPDNGTGTAGAFSWTAGTSASVGNHGTNAHNVTFTPADPGYSIQNQNINITVSPQTITSVNVNVILPVTGQLPNTIASSSGNYTVSAVTWTQGGSLFTGSFLGGTAYTAAVTLTANANYTFNGGLSTATINTNTATIDTNSGSTATLSYTFAATSAKTIAGVAVKTQPALTYTHNDVLNLSALVVTLTYSDNTTLDVPFASFGTYGIATVPANGITLVRSTHDSTAVTVSVSGKSATTSNVTVNLQPITAAGIIVTAPATGQLPNTLASSSGNFSVGAVSWSPVDSPFLGGTAYTATVTVTANANYTFTGGLATATINTNTATIDANTGATATLSYTFPATSVKTVTGITIKTPPTLTYTHGEVLDLSALEATLSYSDSTTLDVVFTNFAANAIATSLANVITLSRTNHNNVPITVIYNSSSTIRANTGGLTINRAAGAPVLSPPTVNNIQASDGTNGNITVSSVSLSPNPGLQTPEYEITTSTATPGAWQSGTSFNLLSTGTSYYIHARSAQNNDYEAGASSVSSAVIFYNVAYNGDANTGGTVPATQSVLSGNSVTISSKGDLAKTGYSFGSWNTATAGGGTNYNPGQSLTVTSNMTLYARWVAEQVFTFTVEETLNNPPIVSGVTVSRSAIGGYSSMATLTETNTAGFFDGGIEWKSGTILLGTGSTFIIDATNIQYNILGMHIITVIGTKAGVQYSTTVSFTVVD